MFLSAVNWSSIGSVAALLELLSFACAAEEDRDSESLSVEMFRPLLPDAIARTRGIRTRRLWDRICQLVEPTTCTTDHQPLRLITCRTGSMLDKRIATRPAGLKYQVKTYELTAGDLFQGEPYKQIQVVQRVKPQH